MTLRELVVAALLALGSGLVALGWLGVLLLRDPLDRLHYLGPAGLGACLLVAAVLVQGGWSLIGWRAILLGGFLLVSAPVLSHATARAIHASGAGGGDDGDPAR
jgi:multicomponent Na+:H+ antiporter subunit G